MDDFVMNTAAVKSLAIVKEGPLRECGVLVEVRL